MPVRMEQADVWFAGAESHRMTIGPERRNLRVVRLVAS
jgi:hypothetical protein